MAEIPERRQINGRGLREEERMGREEGKIGLKEFNFAPLSRFCLFENRRDRSEQELESRRIRTAESVSRCDSFTGEWVPNSEAVEARWVRVAENLPLGCGWFMWYVYHNTHNVDLAGHVVADMSSQDLNLTLEKVTKTYRKRKRTTNTEQTQTERSSNCAREERSKRNQDRGQSDQGTTPSAFSYIDRLQFKGQQIERKFPAISAWTVDMVQKRFVDEKRSGAFGGGKVLDRVRKPVVDVENNETIRGKEKESNGVEVQVLVGDKAAMSDIEKISTKMKILAAAIVKFGKAMAEVGSKNTGKDIIKKTFSKMSDMLNILLKVFLIMSFPVFLLPTSAIAFPYLTIAAANIIISVDIFSTSLIAALSPTSTCTSTPSLSFSFPRIVSLFSTSTTGFLTLSKTFPLPNAPLRFSSTNRFWTMSTVQADMAGNFLSICCPLNCNLSMYEN
nr:uncharacterized protein LOC109172327 [Ipomoea batatas]